MGGQILTIPINAEGAEALFDLFGSLDGIETEAMLAVLTRKPDHKVEVWTKTRPLLH